MSKNTKTFYRDFCGNTYNIEQHEDGSATLNFGLYAEKPRTFESSNDAIIALARYCGYLPKVTGITGDVIKKNVLENVKNVYIHDNLYNYVIIKKRFK